MTRSAMESLLSAILLGAMLAPSAPAAADQVTDSSTPSWVNEALRHDPLVPASEVNVRTQEGVVTLSGPVDNLAAERQAARRVSHVTSVKNERDARDVGGVAWVTNHLFVKADQREDGTIRDDVDVDLESRVEDGVVTLTGRVHDGSQKSHATDVSGRGRGAREVVDEIRVKPATGTNTERSDATLAKEIRDSFRSHWTTSQVADRIRVGVNRGVATLTGDLDTWDERFEAGHVAFSIEGVWKVQNRLTVKDYDYEWEKWEYEAPYYYDRWARTGVRPRLVAKVDPLQGARESRASGYRGLSH